MRLLHLNFLRRRRIGTNLNLLLAGCALLIVTLCIAGLANQRATLLRDQLRVARHEVETALSIITHFHTLATTGTLGDEQARGAAMDALRSMRYGDNDYFWIQDAEPRVLMHPIKTELVGRNVGDMADPNGVRLFAEFARIAQSDGSGFLRYEWSRPGGGADEPKIAFVGSFKPWGWIVGTGIYVGDIDKEMAGLATRYAAATFAVLLVLWLLGRAVAHSVVGPIGNAVAMARALAQGRLDAVRDDLRANNEVGGLQRSLDDIRNTLAGFIDAQDELARQHDAGFISAVIPVERFDGAFRKVAEQLNDLVKSHIAVKMRLVQVAGRYAVGDFSVDMDRLPEEKAVLTQTMDRAKANLQAMNDEILAIVGSAGRGDLRRRGDESRFEYGYRDMIAGINRTLDAIVGPVNDVSRVLSAVSLGDLTERIDAAYAGAFDRLAQDTNDSVAQLAGIVLGIKSAVDSITSAAGEIAAGNADLSHRTEQQVASLEVTASSMEELTSTVRQNAQNARQANDLALGAAQIAEHGGEMVERVIATMAEIAGSSEKIVDIIGVIDGIAFQTNILALNAAVEAARAGEQGRGFAVVASEVRNLAQRSASAAKEIKLLIGESVGRVKAGSTLVGQAGKTMADIVTSVQRVAHIMGEISVASKEQHSGIEQVCTTITQMDETTQQNAALVEEATATARALEDQARELVAAVARFKVAAARETSNARIAA
ncbi:MAG TPA: methyl-accepting chemotaxis protein [Tahibacter sp.]|nr:methyl-accepting chemotaxis protein [Tahibacter sp.]